MDEDARRKYNARLETALADEEDLYTGWCLQVALCCEDEVRVSTCDLYPPKLYTTTGQRSDALHPTHGLANMQASLFLNGCQL